MFRLATYAFRPISPTAECVPLSHPLCPPFADVHSTCPWHIARLFRRPVRVPLSAYVVEDMNEYVHAHATYRFVIVDEEEERKVGQDHRVMMWLETDEMKKDSPWSDVNGQRR